jgi:hypothetical protein
MAAARKAISTDPTNTPARTTAANGRTSQRAAMMPSTKITMA